LAQLMGVMRAPIQKLVGTLAATPSKLVRTLDAVRVQKQAASA
jgi:large subunit ribosomal protein L10